MKIFFICVLLLFSVALSAQPGVWTWMHGSNTPNSAGNFVTLLTPSVTNDPPALEEAGSWNDTQGKGCVSSLPHVPPCFQRPLYEKPFPDFDR